MAEPPLGATAALVRRYDPVLFRTALFAPEPGRGRLMTLYAFDVELSRALSRTGETMISLMRLQWWREVIEGALAGEPPRTHEVATPLNALIGERGLPAPLLEGLIEARESELRGLDDPAERERWRSARFAGLTRLAAECLAEGAAGSPGPAGAAEAGARALAAAFLLRTAVPMAVGQGRYLLPDLMTEDRAALARGETDESLRRTARRVAEDGLAGLTRARALRRAVPAAVRPAFLPLGAAEPVLRRALRPGLDLAALAAPPSAWGALATAWRAVSGRW